MTNNQRFAAEIVILFIIGTLIMSRAAPAKQTVKDVPNMLTTHSLLIVDQHGTPRAKLTADETAPGLLLLDKDGKTVRGRFVIFPDPDHQAQYEASGPTLNVADKNGAEIATLSTRSSGKNETAFLHLHRGDQPPMHLAPVGKGRADIDITAGDNGTTGIYMISVPRNKPSSWATLEAKDNGKSEVTATKFTSTSIFAERGKIIKGKK